MSTVEIDGLAERCITDSRYWFPGIHGSDMSGTLDMGALVHFALGLAGEAGELVNLIKKLNRAHKSGEDVSELLPRALVLDLSDETADVLVYLMDIMAVLGIKPSEAYQRKHAILVERWGQPS